jgi:hypothetical protein
MASKKKQTIGYKYFASGHFVLCHGPIDAITKISFQEKDAYQIEQSTNKTIYINKPSLFGGDEQSGGVEGNVELLFGRADQQKSSTLQRICAQISDAFGGLISAYRGVCSVVFDNVYIGTSPSMPDSKWRVKRIHTRHDGIKQWYDSKAEIGTVSVADLAKIAFILDDSGSMSAANMSNMKAGVNSILSKLADQKIDVMVQAINSGVRIYRHATSADITAAQSFVNNLVASGGTSATSAYGNINTFFNDNYKNGQVITLSDGDMSSVSEAKSMIASAFASVKFVGLGMGTVGSLNEFDNTGNPVQVVDADGISAALNSIFYSEADINPTHIIRECLTNPTWGIGVAESNIDDDSFKSAADTLYTEAMGMSIKWTDSTSINEFVDNIKEHINAQLYLDRVTNKWKLYLIRDDYDVADLISLDESNIRNLDFERRTLAECVNSVTVTYWDRERAKDSTVTVQDIARIAQQGGVISQSIDYKGFTNSDLSSRIALRDLKTLSSTLATVSFDVDESFSEPWHEGMPFKLSDMSYGLSEAVMRIRTIKRGDGINNTVYVEAIEDSFSSPMQSVIEYVPPISSGDSTAKDAVAIAFEVPYIELVEQYGQDEVDAKLSNYPELGYVGMAAIRPNNQHVNASLYVDAGAGYDERTTLDFCPSAELKAEIGYMDSSFELENVAEFELLQANNRIQINNEIMAFVSFDAVTSVITVKRGCFDTVPQKHAEGSKLFGWDNYSGIDDIEYLSGEVLSLKALTLTGSDVLELSEATAHSLALSNRAIRPYPPANVKINGEYYPQDIETDLILTWVDRNRLQETGGEPLSFFDGAVAAEAGTLYQLVLIERDEKNIELRLQNLSIGAVNTFTFATSAMHVNTRTIQIILRSLRDGYESYQAFNYTVELSQFFSAPYDLTVEFKND